MRRPAAILGKKFLVVLTSLAMVTSMCPITAFAAGVTETGAQNYIVEEQGSDGEVTYDDTAASRPESDELDGAAVDGEGVDAENAEGEDGISLQSTGAVTVTKDGTSTDYSTLYLALTSAATGSTITVNQDLTLSATNPTVIIASKELTLDLNGHNVITDRLVTVSGDYASLTLQDTSAGAKGTYTANERGAFALSNTGGSSKPVLTVKSGTWVCNNTATGIQYTTIGATAGTVNIEGGTIVGNSASGPAVQVNKGFLNVSGGTITNSTGTNGQWSNTFNGLPAAYAKDSTTSVTGGTIENTNSTYGVVGLHVDGGTAEISDGTIGCPNSANLTGQFSYALALSNSAKVTVEGGKFFGYGEYNGSTKGVICMLGKEDSSGNPTNQLILKGGKYNQNKVRVTENDKPELSEFTAEGCTVAANTDSDASTYGWIISKKTSGNVVVTDAVGEASYYDTIAEAFQKADDGSTITVSADNLSLDEEITIADKTLTFDLNGHNVGATKSIKLTGSANLTVKESTNADTNSYSSFMYGSESTDADLFVLEGEAEGSKPTLTIEDGQFATKQACVSATNGTVNITGGTLKSYRNGKATTYGETGNVDLPTVYIGSGATLNATDGIVDTYSTNKNTEYLYSCPLVVDGGTAHLDGTRFYRRTAPNNGSSAYNSNKNAAVYVINGANVDAGAYVEGGPAGNIYANCANCVSVLNGSTFTTNGGGFDATLHSFGEVSEDSVVELKGGYFGRDMSDGDFVDYIPEGYTRIRNPGDNSNYSNKGVITYYYKVVTAEEAYGDKAVQVYNGDTLVGGYDTLYAALAAATDGATIKLNADVDERTSASASKRTTTISAQNITLDLNGHTVTKNGIYYVEGSLAVKDTSKEGTGTITEQQDYLFGVQESGSLTIESGTFNSTSRVVDVNGAAASATIKGGSLTSTYNGQVTGISGSTTFAAPAICARNSGTITIEDGKFEATGATSSVLVAAGSSKVDISGGYFKNANQLLVGNNSTISVTGGKYGDTVANYVGEQYSCVKNTDNDSATYPYKVVEAEPVASITKDGVTTTYSSFTAAVAAAESGDEITLIADIADDAPVLDKAGVTLNVNGKNITGELVVKASATIKGKGTIKKLTTSKVADVDCVVEINDVEIIGNGKDAAATEGEALNIGDGTTVNVNSGWIKQAKNNKGGTFNVKGGTLNSYNHVSDSTTNFTGGTYNFDPTNTTAFSGCIPFGYAATDNGDGTWSIGKATELTVSTADEFKQAMEDPDVTKVTLSGDISYSGVAYGLYMNSSVTVAGTKTLDLNGRLLRAGQTSVITINVGADEAPARLTVVDSQASGQVGRITGLVGDVISVAADSEFTLQGGHISYEYTNTGGAQYSAIVNNGGTVNVVGGEVRNGTYNGSNAAISNVSGRLNISGGEVKTWSANNVAITTGSDNAVVNISGGLIRSNQAAEIQIKSGTPTVTVTGGTFAHDFTATIASDKSTNQKSWLAEGATVTDLGSGETYRYQVTAPVVATVTDSLGNVTEYASLQAALDAAVTAGDGAMITLKKDVELDTAAVVKSDVTLDLGDHTVSLKDSASGAPITVDEGKSATVKGVKDDGTNALKVAVSDTEKDGLQKTTDGDGNTVYKAIDKASAAATAKADDGNQYYYESLAEAIKNAVEDSTVELINDAAVDNTIDVDKNLTINTGTHAITGATEGAALKVMGDGKTLNVTGEGSVSEIEVADNNKAAIVGSAKVTKVTLGTDAEARVAKGATAGSVVPADENHVVTETTDADGNITYKAIDKSRAKVAVIEGNGDTAKTYYFETIEDALANAPEGSTIKLEDNLTLDQTATIDKNLTIDLNGKTLSAGDSVDAPLTVGAGVNVTVKGGSSGGATEGTISAIVVADKGKVEVGSGVTASKIVLGKEAEATVDSGAHVDAATVTSSSDDSKVETATDPESGATTYKSVDKDASSDKNVATITKDGKVTFYDTLQEALDAAQDGDTVVVEKDIKLTGDATPATIKTNITLDLGGHTITSEGTGATIAVDGGKDVTIKNGEIQDATGTDASGKTDGNASISVGTGANVTLGNGRNGGETSTAKVGKVINEGTLNVTEGAITGEIAGGTESETNVNGGTTGDITGSEGAVVTVSADGTIGSVAASNADADGLQKTTDDGKTTYKVVNKNSAAAEVTSGEGDGTQTYYYESVADAIKNADEGATVTLKKDEALGATVEVDKNLTIDLNSHKLTGSQDESGNTIAPLKVVDGADGAKKSLDVKNGGSISEITVDAGNKVALDAATTVTKINLGKEAEASVAKGGKVDATNVTATDDGCKVTTTTDADGNTTYKAIAAANAVASVDDGKGNVTYYETLQEALDAAAEKSGKVKIEKDIDLDSTAAISTDVEIDLSGKTITGPAGEPAISIDGSGTKVTITDSSDGTKGSINGGAGSVEAEGNGTDGGAGIVIDGGASGATVTVKGGVTVSGGNGGDATGENGKGGNGGAGITDHNGSAKVTVEDGATVKGGQGGKSNGAGNAGNGGSGVAGAGSVTAGGTDGSAGTITGGNGGDATGSGKGGNGGNGVTGTKTDDVTTNEGGNISGGKGGTSASGEAGKNGKDGEATGEAKEAKVAEGSKIVLGPAGSSSDDDDFGLKPVTDADGNVTGYTKEYNRKTTDFTVDPEQVSIVTTDDDGNETTVPGTDLDYTYTWYKQVVDENGDPVKDENGEDKYEKVEGVTDGKTPTDMGNYKVEVTASTKDGEYYVSQEVPNIVIEDTKVPNGLISVVGDSKSWDNLDGETGFKNQYDEKQTVKIESTDVGSGLVNIDYFVYDKGANGVDDALNEQQVLALTDNDWTNGWNEKDGDVSTQSNSLIRRAARLFARAGGVSTQAELDDVQGSCTVNINMGQVCTVYARFVDAVGNTTYISSGGLLLYKPAKTVDASKLGDNGSFDYDKATGEDLTIGIKESDLDEGVTIGGVKIGDKELVEGTDYVVTDEGIKITDQCLNSLDATGAGEDGYTVEVSYDYKGVPLDTTAADAEEKGAKTDLTLNVEDSEPDAKVIVIDPEGNKTYFDNLKDAIDGASEGSTIKLKDDVTLDETITLDKDVTLDLNGKTATVGEGVTPAITVGENKNVTIKDGTLDGDINVEKGGNLTIDNAQVGNVTTADDAKVTVDGEGSKTGDINAGTGSTTKVTGGETGNITTDGTLDISGGKTGDINSGANSSTTIGGEGTETGNINTEGSVKVTDGKTGTITTGGNGSATIEGGNVAGLNNNGTGDASNITGGKVGDVNTNTGSTTNISGGTIAGNVGGDGTTNISGGTFTSDPSGLIDPATGKVVEKLTGEDGNTTYKVIDKNDAVASVTDGEGNTYYYESLADAIKNAPEGSTVTLTKDTKVDETIPVDKNLTIDLGGNEISGANYSKPALEVGEGKTLNVTGGSGSDGSAGGSVGSIGLDKDATLSVAPGVTADKVTATDNGYKVDSSTDDAGNTIYKAVEDADADKDAVATITDKDGNTKSYDSLEDALKDAKDGDTIELKKDVTVDSTVDVDKDVTLDLGGHTITADGANPAINVGDGADVTIKDGVVDGNANVEKGGSLTLDNAKIGNITGEDGSKVTVGEGSKTGDIDAGKGSTTEVTGGETGNITTDGTLDISGGKTGDITGGADSNTTVSGGETGDIASEGKVTVTGGKTGKITTKGEGSADVKGGNVDNLTNEGSGNNNVSGGNVGSTNNNGDGNTNISGGTVGDVNNAGSGSTNITGGTITGSVTGNNINVDGGTFTTTDPSKFLNDPNYEVIKNADGSYTVRKKSTNGGDNGGDNGDDNGNNGSTGDKNSGNKGNSGKDKGSKKGIPQTGDPTNYDAMAIAAGLGVVALGAAALLRKREQN